jgi:hypothetical protein
MVFVKSFFLADRGLMYPVERQFSGADSIHHIWRYGYRNENQRPQSALKNVVILEKSTPRMFSDIVTEKKFKSNRQSQPD